MVSHTWVLHMRLVLHTNQYTMHRCWLFSKRSIQHGSHPQRPETSVILVGATHTSHTSPWMLHIVVTVTYFILILWVTNFFSSVCRTTTWAKVCVDTRLCHPCVHWPLMLGDKAWLMFKWLRPGFCGGQSSSSTLNWENPSFMELWNCIVPMTNSIQRTPFVPGGNLVCKFDFSAVLK